MTKSDEDFALYMSGILTKTDMRNINIEASSEQYRGEPDKIKQLINERLLEKWNAKLTTKNENLAKAQTKNFEKRLKENIENDKGFIYEKIRNPNIKGPNKGTDITDISKSLKRRTERKEVIPSKLTARVKQIEKYAEGEQITGKDGRKRTTERIVSGLDKNLDYAIQSNDPERIKIIKQALIDNIETPIKKTKKLAEIKKVQDRYDREINKISNKEKAERDLNVKQNLAEQVIKLTEKRNNKLNQLNKQLNAKVNDENSIPVYSRIIPSYQAIELIRKAEEAEAQKKTQNALGITVQKKIKQIYTPLDDFPDSPEPLNKAFEQTGKRISEKKLESIKKEMKKEYPYFEENTISKRALREAAEEDLGLKTVQKTIEKTYMQRKYNDPNKRPDINDLYGIALMPSNRVKFELEKTTKLVKDPLTGKEKRISEFTPRERIKEYQQELRSVLEVAEPKMLKKVEATKKKLRTYQNKIALQENEFLKDQEDKLLEDLGVY